MRTIAEQFKYWQEALDDFQKTWKKTWMKSDAIKAKSSR